MSESNSSRTKTLTNSSEAESIDLPLVADRWSNNISYRQLVVSSCIGIVQFWWHPYLHDIRKLVPFLLLYNVFSICVGYPMFYLELALGIITKKGVLNCWDLAPMVRGLGVVMLSISFFTALALGLVAAWSLAMLVHSFHSFLPWLHCAAYATTACSARHRPLTADSDTPAQSFFFNFVLNLKRDGLETGLGSMVWELAIYFVICWVLIYFITFKRIYSYSKLVVFKDVLAFFMLTSFIVGVINLDGVKKIFQECDWNTLTEGIQIWREALEYSLIEMTVSQGSLIMLGTYCPKQKHKLASTSILAFFASKSICMGSAILLGAAHGALQRDYDNVTNIWPGSSTSMIIWSDYVARIPGSQFWSALMFFTLFVLALSSTALLVQTILSSLTAHSLRKITWAFLILVCCLYCLIGVVAMCTQGGLYILDFLMTWPVTKLRVVTAAAVATTVTYLYGQTTFCEDVYFAVGEYPCMFIRISWAVSPVICGILFLSGSNASNPTEIAAGWSLIVASLLPAVVILLIYLFFKCRVRNIMDCK